MRGAHEGDQATTNWQNTLDYAKDVYKFSFNPPLASIREARDEALAYFRDHVPMLGAIRDEHKQKLYDFLQGEFENSIKIAHEEAVPKALAVIEFTTAVVGTRKQELKRALLEFMTNQYEGFEDAQCRRAMERALDVFNSVLNSQTHTMSDIIKEPIGSDAVHRPTREGKNQRTDCQNALDHAKDVYKSLFKPPLVVHKARVKARAAFNDVAVGAGGPGSKRKKYKHILRDISYKAYQELLKKSHEEAALNALAAFYSRVGAVGCAEQQYKSRLEDFMKNEYEGFGEAECRRAMERAREIFYVCLQEL